MGISSQGLVFLRAPSDGSAVASPGEFALGTWLPRTCLPRAFRWNRGSADMASAWPVLVDRLQTVSTRLGISELPALVLVDGDGRVVGTARGLTRERQVLDLLDALRP